MFDYQAHADAILRQRAYIHNEHRKLLYHCIEERIHRLSHLPHPTWCERYQRLMQLKAALRDPALLSPTRHFTMLDAQVEDHFYPITKPA